jgi:PPK2 family polyphosphate:nucleotide phosphotransferase
VSKDPSNHLIDPGFTKRYLVEPGKKVKLSLWPTGDTGPFTEKDDHDKVSSILDLNIRNLEKLQNILYASRKAAVLVVFQGIDAAGKDGVIKHVFSGINPQGCTVSPFKVPTEEERLHDILWRVHKKCPERGFIGIFNRSHYEEVLAPRVHKMKPKDVWEKYFDQFNHFERMLAENGTVVLKFFLSISQEEQLKRIKERLTQPEKKWKYSPSDLREREFWNDYQAAYEDMLNLCSTHHSPWYVIPADKKWFRNLLVSQILVETMEKLDLKFPKSKIEGL